MRSEIIIPVTAFWMEKTNVEPSMLEGTNSIKINGDYFQFPLKFSLLVASVEVEFTFVGAGSFNLVYEGIIEGNKVALRIPWPTNPEIKKQYPHKAESQERLLKIWDELYPDFFSFKAQSITFTDNNKHVWSAILMPFIEGIEPTPQEIKSAMLEDFKNTGRVPPDGCIPSNYKKILDGKVICVDPIFSLRRAPHEIPREDGAILTRKASQESIEFWDVMNPAYDNESFWKHSAYTKIDKIIIVLTIKALLLLQDIWLPSQDFLALKATAREDNNDVFAFLGKIFDKKLTTGPGFIRYGKNTITSFALLHFQKMREILDAVGLFSKDSNVSLANENDILKILFNISKIQIACNNEPARLDYLCEKTVELAQTPRLTSYTEQLGFLRFLHSMEKETSTSSTHSALGHSAGFFGSVAQAASATPTPQRDVHCPIF